MQFCDLRPCEALKMDYESPDQNILLGIFSKNSILRTFVFMQLFQGSTETLGLK